MTRRSGGPPREIHSPAKGCDPEKASDKKHRGDAPQPRQPQAGSAEARAALRAGCPLDVEPAPATEPEPLLTVEEVAAVLRLSGKTVRRMIARGDLLGRQIGRQWRVRRTHLDAFIRGSR